MSPTLTKRAKLEMESLSVSLVPPKKSDSEMEEEHWTKMYGRLKVYRSYKSWEIEGLPRDFPENRELETWTKYQRKECKRPDRVKLLNAIGFDWNLRRRTPWHILKHRTLQIEKAAKAKATSKMKLPTSTPEEQHWRSMYERLKTYQGYDNGQIPRTFRDDRELERWTKYQRNECTRPDRVQLLNAIGFDWRWGNQSQNVKAAMEAGKARVAKAPSDAKMPKSILKGSKRPPTSTPEQHKKRKAVSDALQTLQTSSSAAAEPVAGLSLQHKKRKAVNDALQTVPTLSFSSAVTEPAPGLSLVAATVTPTAAVAPSAARKKASTRPSKDIRKEKLRKTTQSVLQLSKGPKKPTKRNNTKIDTPEQLLETIQGLLKVDSEFFTKQLSNAVRRSISAYEEMLASKAGKIVAKEDALKNVLSNFKTRPKKREAPSKIAKGNVSQN